MVYCLHLSRSIRSLATDAPNVPPIFRRCLSRNSAIAQGLRENVDQSPSRRSSGRKSRDGFDSSTSRTSAALRPTKASRSESKSSEGAKRPSELGFFNNRPQRPSRRRSGYDDPISSQTLVSIPLTTAASTFVAGMQSVYASLKAGRRIPYKLYLEEEQEQEHAISKYQDSKDSQYRLIEGWGKQLRIPVKYVSRHFIKSALAKHSGKRFQETIHDGILLEASHLPQLPVHSLGASENLGNHFAVGLDKQSAEDRAINGTADRIPYNQNRRNPFVLWLHGVVDTGNVGALYRTALYFGVDAILLTSRATASLQAITTKASAGATEFMQTLIVQNPETFMKESQLNGWKFYAAVAPSNRHDKSALLDKTVATALNRSPCVVVLGNENDGLAPSFVRMANGTVSIKAQSQQAREADLDSLNVSVAGALLCERFLRPPDSRTTQASAPDDSDGRIF